MSRPPAFVGTPVARARLDRLVEHLSPIDAQRLTAIIELIGPGASVTVEEFESGLHPRASRAAATKALARLRENLDDAAAAAGVELRLVVQGAKAEGGNRRLGFVAPNVAGGGAAMPESVAVAGNLIEGREGLVLDGAPRFTLRRGAMGRGAVVCVTFDPAEQELAAQLVGALEVATASYGDYEITFLSSLQILVGESPAERLAAARDAAHLELVGVTPSLLGGAAIDHLDHPIPPHRRHVVPVLLKALPRSADLRGLHELAVYSGPSGRSTAFAQAGQRRDEWVNGLAEQLHDLLARYENVSGSPAASPLAARSRALMTDVDQIPLELRFTVEGQPGGIRVGLTAGGEGPPTGTRVKVLDTLVKWAREGSTPLACVLGEYGMGKTIACQQLVRELQDRRDQGEELPEPHYFDLRNLANLGRSHAVPTLEQIVDECIERGWAAGEAGRPTADELLRQARLQPTLFVFDGLDEALVHLDTAQGVSFTRELLRLRPVGTAAAPVPGCARSHPEKECYANSRPARRRQTEPAPG